jgi:hypothetical protein
VTNLALALNQNPNLNKMDKDNSKSSESVGEKPEDKKPRGWGFFYLLLGLACLGFAIYIVLYDLESIVPLYGTVMTGVLLGALSIFVIIFGYRIIRRDY